MGLAEIHMVAFDGVGYTTDEYDRAVRVLPLDDPNVSQRVVDLTVPVEIPCVVEEDEISWVGNRSLVECAFLLDMGVDNPDAVGINAAWFTIVEIDPVGEKHGAGDACTVIGNASAVARNRSCTHEL